MLTWEGTVSACGTVTAKAHQSDPEEPSMCFTIGTKWQCQYWQSLKLIRAHWSFKIYNYNTGKEICPSTLFLLSHLGEMSFLFLDWSQDSLSVVHHCHSPANHPQAVTHCKPGHRWVGLCSKLEFRVAICCAIGGKLAISLFFPLSVDTQTPQLPLASRHWTIQLFTIDVVTIVFSFFKQLKICFCGCVF